MTPHRAAEVTPDGSPVAVYRAMPANGEPERIHATIEAGASVLELGAGVGRVAGPLARLGHAVTAVDDSPAMLAAMDPDVQPVLDDARSVRLGRRFDVVLLLSHLLDDPRGEQFLATAIAHLAPGGSLIGEVYPDGMDWTALVGDVGRHGPVTVTLVRASVSGDVVDACVRYELEGRSWEQPFVARIRTMSELEALLATAGLRLERWLDRPGWFVATLA